MSSETYQVFILRTLVLVLLYIAGKDVRTDALKLSKRIKGAYSTLFTVHDLD